MALREQLYSFLRPHTSWYKLEELKKQNEQAYTHQRAVYEDCKRNATQYQHEGASRPMHYKPYIRVHEIRMEMRELIQDNRTMHGGIHFPLCIKFKGICRRSEDGQARRTQGTWQYKDKMMRRLGTAPADDRKQQQPNFGLYVREAGQSTKQGLE